MNNLINYGTMRLLVGLLFAFFSSLTVCAQRFGTRQILLSDNGSASKTVSVKSNNPFSIKKDNRFTWVKYEVHDKSIKISASANKTQKARNYSLVLLDEAGNPVDTLEIVQAVRLFPLVQMQLLMRQGLLKQVKRQQRVIRQASHQTHMEDSVRLEQKRVHAVVVKRQQEVFTAGNTTNRFNHTNHLDA